MEKNKQIGTNRVGVMCIGGFVVCGFKKINRSGINKEAH